MSFFVYFKRFPWLIPPLTEEYVAKATVSAILSNKKCLIMPRIMSSLLVSQRYVHRYTTNWFMFASKIKILLCREKWMYTGKLYGIKQTLWLADWPIICYHTDDWSMNYNVHVVVKLVNIKLTLDINVFMRILKWHISPLQRRSSYLFSTVSSCSYIKENWHIFYIL